MARKRTREQFYKSVLAAKKRMRTVHPEKLRKDIYYEKLCGDEYPCIHISAEGRKPDKAIFYLYDSRYCFSMTADEWKFLFDVMDDINAELFVPMYPLAPENSCEDVFDCLVSRYGNLMSGYESGQMIIMGSGAGAGIALSLSMLIWKEGLKDPGKIVLLSPSLDTEFFDKKLLKKLEERRDTDNQYLISEGAREFINEYWVRHSAGRTSLTSPIYEDLTDLAGDVIVAAGTRDIYDTYAREFSRKLADTGNKPFFFEYRDAGYDFFCNPRLEATKHLKKVLHDLLTDTRSAIIDEYMYEIKERGEWSKKFPEIFKDERAVKYLARNKINYEKYKKLSDYRTLIGAAGQHDFDEAVRLFLKEYPDGTVVYVGCSLDTMFERVDNGRVMWYNLDSPGRIAVRNMYTSSSDREKIIDRSIDDLTWFDEVKCDIDKGLMFVCRDIFTYYKQEDVALFVEKLYDRFQGCNIVFDVDTFGGVALANMYGRRRKADYRKRRFYMSDPNRGVEAWDPVFSVVSVKPVLEGVQVRDTWHRSLRFLLRMSRRTQGTKVVRVRLGYEKFGAMY